MLKQQHFQQIPPDMHADPSAGSSQGVPVRLADVLASAFAPEAAAVQASTLGQAELDAEKDRRRSTIQRGMNDIAVQSQRPKANAKPPNPHFRAAPKKQSPASSSTTLAPQRAAGAGATTTAETPLEGPHEYFAQLTAKEQWNFMHNFLKRNRLPAPTLLSLLHLIAKRLKDLGIEQQAGK